MAWKILQGTSVMASGAILLAANATQTPAAKKPADDQAELLDEQKNGWATGWLVYKPHEYYIIYI